MMAYIKEEVTSSNIYNIVGKNIQKFRKMKGYTGEQLATLCNLSYGYIKNLESQKVYATISIETLKLIADKLKVKLGDFFDD